MNNRIVLLSRFLIPLISASVFLSVSPVLSAGIERCDQPGSPTHIVASELNELEDRDKFKAAVLFAEPGDTIYLAENCLPRADSCTPPKCSNAKVWLDMGWMTESCASSNEFCIDSNRLTIPTGVNIDGYSATGQKSTLTMMETDPPRTFSNTKEWELHWRQLRLLDYVVRSTSPITTSIKGLILDGNRSNQYFEFEDRVICQNNSELCAENYFCSNSYCVEDDFSPDKWEPKQYGIFLEKRDNSINVEQHRGYKIEELSKFDIVDVEVRNFVWVGINVGAGINALIDRSESSSGWGIITENNHNAMQISAVRGGGVFGAQSSSIRVANWHSLNDRTGLRGEIEQKVQYEDTIVNVDVMDSVIQDSKQWAISFNPKRIANLPGELRLHRRSHVLIDSVYTHCSHDSCAPTLRLSPQTASLEIRNSEISAATYTLSNNHQIGDGVIVSEILNEARLVESNFKGSLRVGASDQGEGQLYEEPGFVGVYGDYGVDDCNVSAISVKNSPTDVYIGNCEITGNQYQPSIRVERNSGVLDFLRTSITGGYVEIVRNESEILLEGIRTSSKRPEDGSSIYLEAIAADVIVKDSFVYSYIHVNGGIQGASVNSLRLAGRIEFEGLDVDSMLNQNPCSIDGDVCNPKLTAISTMRDTDGPLRSSVVFESGHEIVYDNNVYSGLLYLGGGRLSSRSILRGNIWLRNAINSPTSVWAFRSGGFPYPEYAPYNLFPTLGEDANFFYCNFAYNYEPSIAAICDPGSTSGSRNEAGMLLLTEDNRIMKENTELRRPWGHCRSLTLPNPQLMCQ